MVAVRELHYQHTDVLSGCYQESSETLGVALHTAVLVRAELGHSIDQEPYLTSKLLLYCLNICKTVFNRVVEEAGGDSGRVHPVLGEYLSNSRWVDEVRLARVAGMAIVGGLGKVVRLLNKSFFIRSCPGTCRQYLLDAGHRSLAYAPPLPRGSDYARYAPACSGVRVSGSVDSGR